MLKNKEIFFSKNSKKNIKKNINKTFYHKINKYN